MIYYILYYFLATIKTGTYYIFLLSYLIGNVIVNTVRILLDVMKSLTISLAEVLTVGVEDFYLFINDILEKLLQTFTFITEIYQDFRAILLLSVQNIIWLWQSVLNFLSAVFSTLITLLGRISAVPLSLVYYTKYFILLLGSGVWFAITLIPLFIIYLNALCVFYIQSLIQELKNFVASGYSSIYHFIHSCLLGEVTTESVLGLLAIIAVSLIMHTYRRALKFVLTEACSKIYKTLFVRHKRNRRPARNVEYKVDHNTYCCICQAEQKCVLILPCKHLCLCSNCENDLPYYQDRCPICRTRVKKTMKVFV